MPTVARVIKDVALRSISEPVINVVHPLPVAWETVVHYLSHSLAQHGITDAPLPSIGFSEWVQRVEAADKLGSSVDVDNLPVAKMLSFFHYFAERDSRARQTVISSQLQAGGRARYKMGKAMLVSDALKEVMETPIAQKDTDLWVNYWKSTKFL